MRFKRILLNISVLLIIFMALSVLIGCVQGFATPEEALEDHRLNGFGFDFDARNYEIQTHFTTVHFEESAVMVFLARSNNLMMIHFPRNQRNQTFSALTVSRIDLSDEFWIDLLEREVANWGAWLNANTTIARALNFSPRQAYVNGIPAETIRFEVTDSNGITHNVQFWYKELQGRNAQFTVEYRDIGD